jgi:hypothetical protein
MTAQSVTPLLRRMAREHPAYPAKQLWDEAVETAGRSRHRGKAETSASATIAQLRNALKGEVVAFHKQLSVAKDGDGRRWRVQIPLTLFPKRDQGFTDVECAVEFEAPSGASFRVVDALPVDKADTLAEAAMGAELQVEASAKAGAPIPIAVGTTVAAASAKVYGSAKMGMQYSVRRSTVQCEVLKGTGALWRLENPSRPHELAAESHQLAVVLEADPGCVLNAAGYLKASSEVQWLSSSVGRLFENLGESIRKFMNDGAPVEAYGEWREIVLREPV